MMEVEIILTYPVEINEDEMAVEAIIIDKIDDVDISYEHKNDLDDEYVPSKSNKKIKNDINDGLSRKYMTTCFHGYNSSLCYICGHTICTHNSTTYKKYCRLCGKGCCIHKRNKDRCRDCGTGLCIHHNWKHACKKCGNGYCVHGKRKGRCSICSKRKREENDKHQQAKKARTQ